MKKILAPALAALLAFPIPAGALDRMQHCPVKKTTVHTCKPMRSGENRPVVYLTLDDGPGELTPQFLAVLAKYEVPATFFLIGGAVKVRPSIIPQYAAGGHRLGNHTYTHPDLRHVSAGRVGNELTSTANVIAASGGGHMSCMRPPFGSRNRTTDTVSRQLGFEPILWDIDTRDWERGSTSASIIAKMNTAVNGSVILLHDGGPRVKSLHALEAWLAANASRYQFLPLPQC
jgi:peptidoglycan-N-acetylglucosamine deacetylase